MQIIITMAGKGQRFSEAGFIAPKPIVEVGGKPAIEYLINSFDLSWKFIFCVGEHFKNTEIEKTILKIKPNSQIIYTKYSERGPIDTVLAAIPYLNFEEPVLVSYCDMALVWSCNDFKNKVKNYDMAVINYQGFHPTYLGPNTYCHVQVKNGEVIALQEKKLFTDSIDKEITSAGVYYFKTGELLKEALAAQLAQNLKYGNEFYISLAIQALLNKQNVRVLDYRIEHFFQFGTPEDIKRFECWYNLLILKSENVEFNSVKFEEEKKYWSACLSKLLVGAARQTGH